MSSSGKSPSVGAWDDELDGPSPKSVPDLTTSTVLWDILASWAVLWLLVALAIFSDALPNLITYPILSLIGLLLAIAWPLMAFLLERPGTRLGRVLRAFTPASGLLGLVLMSDDLRLNLSEPALRVLVSEVQSGKVVVKDPGGRRAGLFVVSSAYQQDGCVLLSSASALSESGLIYCPGERPPQWSPEYVFRHLTGPWWYYENNF